MAVTLDQRLGRLGGACAWLAAAAFAVRGLLAWDAGLPPSEGTAILAWLGAHLTTLRWAVEVTFFAMMFLVPALVALTVRVARTHPVHAVVGASAWTVTIVLPAMAVVVEGRLVFPVLGIALRAADVAELVVALDFGAWHAIRLVEVVATLAVGLGAWRRTDARLVAWSALFVAVADVAAAYPEAIGASGLLACDIVSALWLLAAGRWLLGAAELDTVSGSAAA